MGELAALGAALVWAFASAAFTALVARASPLWVSGLRLASASAVIALLAILTGAVTHFGEIPPLRLAAVAGSGVLAYAVGDTWYMRVLGRIGMSRAFPASMAMFIALTVAGGVVVLGEPFTPGLPVGGAAIAVGIWLLARESGRATAGAGAAGEAAGSVAAFVELVGVAATWAAATLILAWGQEGLNALEVGLLRTPTAAVAVLAVAALAARDGFVLLRSQRRVLLGIGAAGALGTAGGTLLYIFAVAEAGAARTAVLSATSPVMALPVALLVLREPITAGRVAGTLACVAGILLVVV